LHHINDGVPSFADGISFLISIFQVAGQHPTSVDRFDIPGPDGKQQADCQLGAGSRAHRTSPP